MEGLKIIKATYFDPKQGHLKGTDVTEELSGLIKDHNIIYSGKYNDIFSDHFKNVRKKLRIELEFGGRKYIVFYLEDKKINLQDDWDLLKKRKIDLNNPWLVALITGIILLALGAASLSYKWPPILYNQDREPKIRLNLTEAQEWNLNETIRDFNYLYSTSQGQGMLVAVKNIDFNLLNRAFESIFVTPDFITCKDCAEYNVEIYNAGSVIASDISIKLEGTTKILPFYKEDIPEQIKLDCTQPTDCTMIIKSLGVGEVLRLPLLGGSGGVTVYCTVGGEQDYCKKDYINVLAAVVPSTYIGDIHADGITVRLPKPDDSGKKECYTLDTKSIRWLSSECTDAELNIKQYPSNKIKNNNIDNHSMTKQELENILKEGGYNFDISSIPDNDIIHSYNISY